MYFKTETLVGVFIVLALSLFAYMSFQLGSVRLNLARYASYDITFNDVSGLSSKADIKMSGVKVGWVDSVTLDPQTVRVRVAAKILKEYRLFEDATAHVRQEGLLGVKFLEIMPGTPEARRIEPGGSLGPQTQNPVRLDEILGSLQALADEIKGLSGSLSEAAGEFRQTLTSMRERFVKFDEAFDLVKDTKQDFVETAKVVKQAGQQVTQLLATQEEPDQEKSQGSIARLMTDKTIYEDIKATTAYTRSCIERVRNIGVAFDNHFEILPHSYCDEEEKKKTNFKWYAAGYVADCAGLFGKLGLTYSAQGYAKHKGPFCPQEGSTIPDNLFIRGHRNATRLNLQVGKYWYSYAALRGGIFEGTAGAAIDWWMAFNKFKWLSTFEVFDVRGYNRFNADRRPHLKWLNRLFFSNNVYLAFGVDDFASCVNRSGFIGIGTYFALPTIMR